MKDKQVYYLSEKINDLETNIYNLNNISEEIKYLGDSMSQIDDLINKTDLEKSLKLISNLENNLNNFESDISILSNDYYNYKNNLFSIIFPVGSYYISSNNVNPSGLFGGNWVQIKDRFIIGASDKYKVNTEGGEENHKLTADEMPSHRHNTLDWNHRGMYFWGGDEHTTVGPSYGEGFRTHAIDIFTSWSGGNQAHNNIPPYKAAFIWRRTS